MEKIDILSLTPEVLGQHLAEMGEPNDYTFSPTPAEAERKILYK